MSILYCELEVDDRKYIIRPTEGTTNRTSSCKYIPCADLLIALWELCTLCISVQLSNGANAWSA
jgi:hypothetical protein